jgi:drug/metabolite transporter (DMT)-like permease
MNFNSPTIVDTHYKNMDMNRVSTPSSKNYRVNYIINDNTDKETNKYSIQEKRSEPHIINIAPNERWGYFFFFLAAVLFGVAAFQIKYLAMTYPADFSPNGFMIWRSTSICLLGLLMILKNQERLISPLAVKNRFWFIMRTFGNYISFVFLIGCMLELRAATASCFSSMYPILVLIFSIFILKEKFYIRYLIGLVLCLAGALMIITNDKKITVENAGETIILEDSIKIHEHTHNSDANFIRGIFCGTFHVMTLSLVVLATKILAVENLGPNEQCFYLGASNALAGFIASFFVHDTLGRNPLYISLSLFNGGIFYIATICLVRSMKGIAINKLTPLTYFTTITVFILGILCFNEPCYLTDMLGSLMIVLFNAYNSLYPVK